MKKLIIFLIAIMPLIVSAQTDFDYTFSTSKMLTTIDSQKVQLIMFRTIKKEGRTIRLIPTNTGDEQEYKVEFYGVQRNENVDYLSYHVLLINDEKPTSIYLVILINPMQQTVEIRGRDSRILYYN